MFYGWTDDPVGDAEEFYEECENSHREWVKGSPECDKCGKHTAEADEWYYDFDEYIVCSNCIGKRIMVTNKDAKCSICEKPLFDKAYYYMAFKDDEGNYICDDCEEQYRKLYER